MAFGISKNELLNWKKRVRNEKISILTHYWQDERFPGCTTVTKVGCANIDKLVEWGEQFDLKSSWIDYHCAFPHFDLFGQKQKEVLIKEGMSEQITRFKL